MKTMRWMGLRNCIERQKVKMMVEIPITERVEAERSTKVRARIWSWVRPIVIAIACHLGGGTWTDAQRVFRLAMPWSRINTWERRCRSFIYIYAGGRKKHWELWKNRSGFSRNGTLTMTCSPYFVACQSNNRKLERSSQTLRHVPWRF